MVYNLSGIDASNHTLDLINSMNTSSDQALIGWLLVIIWFVMIMVYKNRDIKPVSLFASIIVTVLAILAFVAGWISVTLMIIPAILFFISVLINLFVS